MAVFLIAAFLSLLVAFAVHEYAHAAIAYQLGDPTAKYDGRLTLNPLVHLDPVGSLVVFGCIVLSQGHLVVGWAKPVLFDQDNLKNPVLDSGLIAFAGPFSNFVLGFLGGLPFLLGLVPNEPMMVQALYVFVSANVGFGVFNCLPLPPLDGWKMAQVVVPRELAYRMQDIEVKVGLGVLFGFLVLSYLLGHPIVRPLTAFLVGLFTGV